MKEWRKCYNIDNQVTDENDNKPEFLEKFYKVSYIREPLLKGKANYCWPPC